VREVQIRVPGGTEMTQHLSREDGVSGNIRSRLRDAVVAVDPGTALFVRVGRSNTILPWSVVEGIGYDDGQS
jgi:hypothetical protein